MVRNYHLYSGMLVVAVLLFSCQTTEKRTEDEQITSQNAKLAKLTPQKRTENIKIELKQIKADLAKDGHYNCCIHPTCNWCLLHEGECECHDNLKAGKEVCPGCGLGWRNGNGVVQGVQANQVKWDIAHEHESEGHAH
ncbi:MAG: hypothetical protein ACE5IY_08065 [bacterium]